MASPMAVSPLPEQVLRGSDTTRVSTLHGAAQSPAGTEPRTTVIILKKMQGSVWRETGRTTVCPTPEWLSSSYGAGEYELRLKRGNRVVCMVGVAAS
jgi:hypothetical protein